jgi:hypothetical protein
MTEVQLGINDEGSAEVQKALVRERVTNGLEVVRQTKESNAAIMDFLGRAVRLNADLKKHLAAMNADLEKATPEGWPEGMLDQAQGIVTQIQTLADGLEAEHPDIVNWDADTN